MYSSTLRTRPKCAASCQAPPAPCDRLANQAEASDAERKLVDAYKDLKPLPFQPPWAVLPWLQPTPPRPLIKQVVRPPDITVTGRIFDLFV